MHWPLFRRWPIYAVLASLAAGAGVLTLRASNAQEGVVFPWYPAFIQVEKKDGTPPMPENWQDPQVCAGCHPRQYKGWSTSMHSISFKDPVFQAEWALAYRAMGEDAIKLCGGCHSPIGVVTGTIKFDPKLGKHGGFTAPPIAEKGVSCDVCHTLSGTNAVHTTTGSPGNASFILSPGPVKRATLKDARSPFHATEYSELHASAKFCANCHNIFHPDNRFPIEHTYDEWKSSPYAQRGIQCQDCHMVPVDVAIRVADEMKRPKDLEGHGLGGLAGMGAAGKRELVHDHGFVGGNTIIAEALGVQGAAENKAEATKRLQNAAELDFELVPGRGGAHMLKVKVTNKRAGHHLPTSLTFIRQLWLEVHITDDQGRELLKSGVAKDNRVPTDAVRFINRSVDKDGKPTINPWEIASFDHLNTIPPKGYRYGVYAFHLPADAKRIRVQAKLNYQSYAQEVADKLLGEGKLTVPIVVMKELSREYTAADLTAMSGDPARVARR